MKKKKKLFLIFTCVLLSVVFIASTIVFFNIEHKNNAYLPSADNYSSYISSNKVSKKESDILYKDMSKENIYVELKDNESNSISAHEYSLLENAIDSLIKEME